MSLSNSSIHQSNRDGAIVTLFTQPLLIACLKKQGEEVGQRNGRELLYLIAVQKLKVDNLENRAKNIKFPSSNSSRLQKGRQLETQKKTVKTGGSQVFPPNKLAKYPTQHSPNCFIPTWTINGASSLPPDTIQGQPQDVCLGWQHLSGREHRPMSATSTL